RVRLVLDIDDVDAVRRVRDRVQRVGHRRRDGEALRLPERPVPVRRYLDVRLEPLVEADGAHELRLLDVFDIEDGEARLGAVAREVRVVSLDRRFRVRLARGRRAGVARDEGRPLHAVRVVVQLGVAVRVARALLDGRADGGLDLGRAAAVIRSDVGTALLG